MSIPLINKKYHVPDDEIYELKTPSGETKKFRREGKCDSSLCGAACCMVYCISGEPRDYPAREYDELFRKDLKVEDAAGNKHSVVVIEKRCSQLACEKCLIHESRPIACYQFPTPDDLTYLAVKEKCSFKFVEVKEEVKS